MYTTFFSFKTTVFDNTSVSAYCQICLLSADLHVEIMFKRTKIISGIPDAKTYFISKHEKIEFGIGNFNLQIMK